MRKIRKSGKLPSKASRRGGRSVQPRPHRGDRVLRSLLNGVGEGVAQVSRQGRILYANRRFAEMLGVSNPGAVAGKSLMRFVSAASWVALDAALSIGLREAAEGELTVEAKGQLRPITIRVSFAPLGENGASVRVVATEVTELRETTRALKESEASVHSLSARLLQVQDDERRRMARDLHDITGQELAVAVMTLESLKKKSGESNGDLNKAITESTDLLRKVETEIRTLSYLLHPPLLDEMGLGSALHWFVDGFRRRTGIDVQLEVPKNLPRPAREQEIALFRVAQESLANVFRHSGSGKARVRMHCSENRLELSVEDDGRGFEGSKTAAPFTPGVGIQSMRGRLEPLGGTLEIHSGRKGTHVLAAVPLPVKGVESLEDVESLDAALRKIPHSSAKAANPSGCRRILIADDHEMTRRGLRDMLSHEPSLEVCAEANDGVEALQRIEELGPDLVILDLNMPRMGGLSVAHHLREAGVPIKILIYTNHVLPDVGRMARGVGCDGLVLKTRASEDLLRGIWTVLRGGTFYESETARAQTV